MYTWHFKKAGGKVVLQVYEFKFIFKAVNLKRIVLLIEVTSKMSNPFDK